MQSTEPEAWLPIHGWEGVYAVSDYGNVRNERTGYVLCPSPIRQGYLAVTLAKAPRRELHSVHQLVAAAFSRGPGSVVRHLDGNKLNNHSRNLSYGTQSENILDSVAHGTHHHARKTRCVNGHSIAGLPRDGNRKRKQCPTCRREAKAKRLASPTLEHGTQKSYSYGCRCANCISAYATYQKAKREARKERA